MVAGQQEAIPFLLPLCRSKGNPCQGLHDSLSLVENEFLVDYTGSEGAVSQQYLLGSVGRSDAKKELIQTEEIKTKVSKAVNGFFFLYCYFVM